MFVASIGKLSQCIFGHLDVVTCLALSDDFVSGSTAIAVSGSRDATVLVWLWDNKRHRIVVPNDLSCKWVLICYCLILCFYVSQFDKQNNTIFHIRSTEGFKSILKCSSFSFIFLFLSSLLFE